MSKEVTGEHNILCSGTFLNNPPVYISFNTLTPYIKIEDSKTATLAYNQIIITAKRLVFIQNEWDCKQTNEQHKCTPGQTEVV